VIKLLVVNDDRDVFTLFESAFKPKCIVLWAPTQSEAGSLIVQHPDINAIIMAASIAGETINTLKLTKKIRENLNFTGLIFAQSIYPDYLNLMLAAGCDAPLKDDLINPVREKLNI
jgi:hypothetical protein